MRELCLIIGLLCFLATNSFAQSTMYKGRVVHWDKGEKEPMIGVSIHLPGSMESVSSDINGDFEIAIPDSIPAIVFLCFGWYDGCPTYLFKDSDFFEINLWLSIRRYKRKLRMHKKLWIQSGQVEDTFY